MSKSKLFRAARVDAKVFTVGGNASASRDKEEPQLKIVIQEDPRIAIREALKKEMEEELERHKFELMKEVEAMKASGQADLKRQKDEVKAERDSTRLQLQAEGDQIRESSKKKGYEDGYAKGLADGREQGKKKVIESWREHDDLFNSMISSLEIAKSDMDELIEVKLVRMVQLAVERILRREMSSSTDTIKLLLRFILQRLSDREKVVIYMHPDDIKIMDAARAEFSELFRPIKDIQFISDDQIERGGCLVETRMGIYDGRIKTQLEQIGLEIDKLLFEGRRG